VTARPPLVSVVIATNRAGPYLSEALASVSVQTYPSVEVIVVDDGSPEPDLVAAAAAEVPGSVLIRQKASGVSVARNIGTAHARGELLAFLDDDDRWHPDRLAAQTATLLGEPDAVVSYCGMRTIDDRGAVLVEADQVAITDRTDVARRTTGIILPNLLMRRDAFHAVGGFHSGIRFAEDLDLVLRLAERGPVAFEPRALVDYRAHAHNTTSRHRALTRGIDHVLRLHEWSARERGDRELVAALRDSLRKNERFAWWSAGRAARAALRDRRPARALGELGWALATAPRGLLDGAARRVRRSSGDRTSS
jgi:glycosyltransferase involved in cell wall biosynthesis